LIDLIRPHVGAGEALIEPHTSTRIDYRELLERVGDAAERLREAGGGHALALLAMGQDAGSIVLYLACLQAGIPLCLADPRPEPLARLVEAYRPELLLLPDGFAVPPGYRVHEVLFAGYRVWRREAGGERTLHPDLALLLTTSGSTGSPKLVRLTARNLASNAIAIVNYLGIGPGERAIASLPVHYSYGLSVLNSHLSAGASVVLTPHSFMRPEFWSVFDSERCTGFAGVPYMYETLHRLRFDPSRHPTLRTLTQAGGGLRPELIAHYQQLATTHGLRFFVMYGQTEATARISYVPPERLSLKIGSIGVAIPDGRLRLEPVEDSPGLMELVYEGPNVMMGYAEGPDDLALGDRLGGVLRTGDLGSVDEDGYFRVTGRLTRFAKLFGRRVSLQDIEQSLEDAFAVRVAASDGGDRIVIHTERLGEVDLESVTRHLAGILSVPPTAIVIRPVERLPRTASGKKDYRALEAAG